MTALDDPDPLVQGRAAEGARADRAQAGGRPHRRDDAAAHSRPACSTGIAPDDLEYPKPPPVEAVRLGMYALVRLSAYDALASVLLDGAGQPISRWWPVAYAFRRVNDPHAGPVLLVAAARTTAS